MEVEYSLSHSLQENQNPIQTTVVNANFGCGAIEEKYDAYTKILYHPDTIGVACSLLQRPKA